MPIVNATELLREIDLSVRSWCSEHAPADAAFHGAVMDEWNPTAEEMEMAWANFYEMHGRVPGSYRELVFRKPTWEHVPEYYGRRAAPARGLSATGLPFQPFLHFRYFRHRPKCVMRSHWIGLVDGGRFRTPTDPQGRLTENLGAMINAMVDAFGSRGNWKGYTHLDDMKGDARLALATGLIKFSPIKSNNPFGYASQVMQTSFLNSLSRHKEVWGTELLMGNDDMLEDGIYGDVGPEGLAAAAARELEAGQVHFDAQPWRK